METYELIVAFKPYLDAENLDNIINTVSTYIKDLGGEIVSHNKLGRKRLSVDIAGFKDAIYVQIIYTLDPANVASLKLKLKHNEEVVRVLILRLDKKMKNFLKVG